MKATAVEQDAINETYDDVKLLIFNVVHRFAKEHGLKFKDLDEHIGPIFMKAYFRFDESKGVPFPAHISRVVYQMLLDVVRNHARRARAVTWMPLDNDIAYNFSFNLIDFIDELSPDGRSIVKLVFDTPPGLAKIIHREGGGPQQYRNCIRQYLSGQGWSFTAITKAFTEIRKALK